MSIELKQGKVTTILPMDYEIAGKTIEEILSMTYLNRSRWYKTILPEEKAKAIRIVKTVANAKMKQLWQDPESSLNSLECKKKQSDATKRQWEDPKHRKKVSDAMKRHWQDPNSRFNSLGFKKKQSDAMKQQWNIPGFQKKFSEMMKRTWQDPNSGHNNPERGKKQSEAHKRNYQDPEFGKKRSIVISAARQGIPVDEWTDFMRNDPDYMRRWHLKNTGLSDEWTEMALAQKQNRTSIELMLECWLAKHNVHYEFQKYIRLHSTHTYVDFFIEPNICVYCDGDYWHKSEKQKQIDARITQELESMGFVVIRLTGTEIRAGIRPWRILDSPPPEFEQMLLDAGEKRS